MNGKILILVVAAVCQASAAPWDFLSGPSSIQNLVPQLDLNNIQSSFQIPFNWQAALPEGFPQVSNFLEGLPQPSNFLEGLPQVSNFLEGLPQVSNFLEGLPQPSNFLDQFGGITNFANQLPFNFDQITELFQGLNVEEIFSQGQIAAQQAIGNFQNMAASAMAQGREFADILQVGREEIAGVISQVMEQFQDEFEGIRRQIESEIAAAVERVINQISEGRQEGQEMVAQFLGNIQSNAQGAIEGIMEQLQASQAMALAEIQTADFSPAQFQGLVGNIMGQIQQEITTMELEFAQLQQEIELAVAEAEVFAQQLEFQPQTLDIQVQ